MALTKQQMNILAELRVPLTLLGLNLKFPRLSIYELRAELDDINASTDALAYVQSDSWKRDHAW